MWRRDSVEDERRGEPVLFKSVLRFGDSLRLGEILRRVSKERDQPRREIVQRWILVAVRFIFAHQVRQLLHPEKSIPFLSLNGTASDLLAFVLAHITDDADADERLLQ